MALLAAMPVRIDQAPSWWVEARLYLSGCHAGRIEQVAQHHRVGAAVVARALPDLELLGRLPARCSVVVMLSSLRLVALAAEDAVHLDMLVRQLALGAVEVDLQPLPGGVGARACS